MSKKNRKHTGRFTLLKFSFAIAAIILLVFIIVYLCFYLLTVTTKLIQIKMPEQSANIAAFVFVIIIVLIIGYFLAFFASRLILKPIQKIISCFDSLSSGDYNTRLKFKGSFSTYPPFEEFCNSFNKMAEELSHTEMLSSDFINNFSHEFKTPIVSIVGFTKLLKKENISEAQKKEYVNIIEEESERLSSMTTSILNLIKIENQSMLPAKNKFNLSEQIRNCVLLLESKWSSKNFDFQIDFNEYTIKACEEILKQVWINLIDNAIKFTPENGIIKININEDRNNINVDISNSGSFIPLESRDRIFNKFYQGDVSHASEGNGIGLAVVKKIVLLHGGSISVNCNENFTTFSVVLPK